LGTEAYVNFLDSATPTDTLACYPAATLARLQAVKAEYDPDNVFNRTVGVGSGH
jgi:Berberine and berberine like.